MADVRLTATNPADSSVVPVACNERGELKLEEIPDQSFDGNLDGNLTVSGSAEFGGSVTLGPSPVISGRSRYLSISADTIGVGGERVYSQVYYTTDSKVLYGFKTDGSATFAGNVQVGGNPNQGTAPGTRLWPDGRVQACRDSSAGQVWATYVEGTTTPTSEILAGGSARFASNKAGFTAEGYLWCTTRRGDTVMLDATSNGLASWVPYTPPTRLTELQDRWSEKNVTRPKPEESSQDEPEIPQ